METKKIIYLLTGLFLAGYFVTFLLRGDLEFLIYVVVALVLVALVYWTDSTFDYPLTGVIGFSIWVVLHMLGGSVSIGNGQVLYAKILIPIVGEPYNILKYDQFLHFYCYVVVGLLVYWVARRYFKKTSFGVLLIVVLAATGVGALNEIVEFLAVVFAESNGVGDYINNAQDLVFNLIGSIVGVWLGTWLSKNSKFK